MTASDMLTAKEVALLLRVSADAVYDAFHRGALPGVRIGRAIRFRRGDVEAYLAGGGDPPPAE